MASAKRTSGRFRNCSRVGIFKAWDTCECKYDVRTDCSVKLMLMMDDTMLPTLVTSNILNPNNTKPQFVLDARLNPAILLMIDYATRLQVVVFQVYNHMTVIPVTCTYSFCSRPEFLNLRVNCYLAYFVWLRLYYILKLEVFVRSFNMN